MNAVLTEIIVIVVLIFANGFLAMSELALVSVQKARFQKLAEKGDARARAALELVESPSRFLSTVQVGITLIGVLAGAFGGATIAEVISDRLKSVPGIGSYGEAIGVGIVVISITFLSVVIGELVPKRIAMSNPTGIALFIAKPIRRLSLIAGPVVHTLSTVTDWVLRIFGIRADDERPVTKDEVRAIVQQSEEGGELAPVEKELVDRALVLEKLRAADLMTSGARVVWLNLADPEELNWRKIVGSGHSYFPVYDRSRDQVQGIVSVKALWANLALAGKADLRHLLVKPLFVPETTGALKLLEAFKQSRMHVALVTDEFGTVQGLVTMVDVLKELVGEFPAYDERRDTRFVKRADGSWLVDGTLEIEEFRRLLKLEDAPEEMDADCRTVGGLVLARLQRIPKEGDSFEAFGHRFEVADMDRHRVDKVIVQRLRRGSEEVTSNQ